MALKKVPSFQTPPGLSGPGGSGVCFYPDERGSSQRMKKRIGRLLVMLVLLATALVVYGGIAQARPPTDFGLSGYQSTGATHPVSTTDSGDPDSGGTIKDPTVPLTRVHAALGGHGGFRLFEWTSRIWAKLYTRAAF